MMRLLEGLLEGLLRGLLRGLLEGLLWGHWRAYLNPHTHMVPQAVSQEVHQADSPAGPELVLKQFLIARRQGHQSAL